MKFISFCTEKETIKKNERTLKEWEKIFANNVTNKGLISKIYKQFMQSNINKTQKNPNKKTHTQKQIEDPNRHVSKEGIQMADRHTEECSTLLVIREMQMKTTMRYHLVPIRMAILKKSASSNFWRGCEGKGTLLHC